MRTVFVFGLGPLAASAPPLILMAREFIVGASVAGRYSIDPLLVASKGTVHRSAGATIGGHTVTLTDDPESLPEPHDFGELRHEGQVGIDVTPNGTGAMSL